MLDMQNLSDQLEVKFYREVAGCGSCGRFGLSVESFDSEHTPGWIRATCPACSWSEKRPLRAVRTLGEVKAA
jgi:hypothetical protein